MKIVLVVNPSASGVNARARVMIQNALSADHDLTVTETSRRGHATRIAQSAATTGAEIVVALGGDGTVNEVANGLARTDTALGVLPGGSTNVFARTLGLTNEPIEATDQLLEAIGRGSIRRVSLGNVNGRFFCFHVGVGFDAAVVETVERYGQMKRWFGHPLFVWAAVDTWARRYDRTSAAFRVDTSPGSITGPAGQSGTADADADADAGDVPFVAASTVPRPGKGIDGFFTVVLNTDPYTYLGSRPLSLAPGNDLTNPLSVVTLTSLRLASTGAVIARALRGRQLRGRGVTVDHGVKTLRITGHRPFPWQVDGDHLGDAEELLIRWEPEVMNLVMP